MCVLGGTFGCFTVVPGTGLMESNVFLDAIWMVWGLCVWLMWYLASVGVIGLVYKGWRFFGCYLAGLWYFGVVWGVSTHRPKRQGTETIIMSIVNTMDRDT